MVPVRDGIRLATDIYLPLASKAPRNDRWPVIMERTPYDKRGISRSEFTADKKQPASRVELAEFFVRRGYAVVMQDCRGRHGSEGEFTKYVHEAEDGYDVVAWLLQQPWCNGAIGTMGFSYGAHTQCALASLNPPGLACMFIDSGGFASAFHGGIRRGGAFELKQATWAHRHALRSHATLNDPSRQARLLEKKLEDWFREMPWQPGQSPLAAAPEYEKYLFGLWRAGRFSDYWRQPGLFAQGFYDSFPDVPTAILGSWYDPYVYSCINNFQELSTRKNSLVTLLMGPWTHGDRSQTYAGEVDFGLQSTLDNNLSPDYRQFRLSWFDRWLKKIDTPARESRVNWFQMGGGSGECNADGRMQHGGNWRNADRWPPSDTDMQTLYLHANGKLLPEPTDASQYLDFRFDPLDPVPTIGGALTSGEPLMRGGAFDQRETQDVFKYSGEPRGEPLSARADVLVFETGPLQEDTIVTGEVEIELWVSSDCLDTDFTAKLIDVYPSGRDYPDGFAMNITDGIFRMRYRDGWEREAWLQKDEIYRITIAPFAISNLFQEGHRLRIDISSSNYPHFDLNPNTGEPEGCATYFKVANNRVCFGKTHASRVMLPIVPKETK